MSRYTPAPQTTVINNTCYVDYGHYCDFELKGGTKLTNRKWASSETFDRFLNHMDEIDASFMIQAERSKFTGYYNAFRGRAPFAEKTRFPQDLVFYNLAENGVSHTLSQMRAAVNYKDRMEEKDAKYDRKREENYRNDWSINDASTAFNKALNRLHEIYDSEIAGYDRLTFERSFNLEWVCGDKRDPMTKPCLPPQRPKPEFTVLSLLELLDDKKPTIAGGTPNKADNFRYSINFPDDTCLGYSTSARLGDLDTDRIVENQGYVYFRHNPLFDDVAFYYYDLEKNQALYVRKQPCGNHPSSVGKEPDVLFFCDGKAFPIKDSDDYLIRTECSRSESIQKCDKGEDCDCDNHSDDSDD